MTDPPILACALAIDTTISIAMENGNANAIERFFLKRRNPGYWMGGRVARVGAGCCAPVVRNHVRRRRPRSPGGWDRGTPVVRNHVRGRRPRLPIWVGAGAARRSCNHVVREGIFSSGTSTGHAQAPLHQFGT